MRIKMIILPVSSVVTDMLSVREVWTLILGNAVSKSLVETSAAGSRPGVCNLFHWGATFENFNNVEGQSPSNMYKIIKC